MKAFRSVRLLLLVFFSQIHPTEALLVEFLEFLQQLLCWLSLGWICSSLDPPPPPPPSNDPTAAPVAEPPTTPEPDIWQPGPGTTWQWQLQGDTIDVSFNVEMYDIDLFDVPQATIDQLHADSRIVICYLSAGSYENFRPDKGEFPEELLGNTLSGFDDERWLDINNPNLRPIMQRRLDLAVSKACDGVEPDNVDGYTQNTGFSISASDQLVYNRWLASEAHERGLSIGLKNDLDQVNELVDDFDWALNEQCFQYNECELLKPFVDQNKAVFGVEYMGDPSDFCPPLTEMGFSWLMKEEELFALPRLDCLDF